MIRLKIAADDVEYRIFPLLRQLGKMAGVPKQWTQRMTICANDVVARLRETAKALEEAGLGADRYVVSKIGSV